MKKLVKNVVEKTWEFELVPPNGKVHGTVKVNAESEDAARLKLRDNPEGWKWKLLNVEDNNG